MVSPPEPSASRPNSVLRGGNEVAKCEGSRSLPALASEMRPLESALDSEIPARQRAEGLKEPKHGASNRNPAPGAPGLPLSIHIRKQSHPVCPSTPHPRTLASRGFREATLFQSYPYLSPEEVSPLVPFWAPQSLFLDSLLSEEGVLGPKVLPGPKPPTHRGSSLYCTAANRTPCALAAPEKGSTSPSRNPRTSRKLLRPMDEEPSSKNTMSAA